MYFETKIFEGIKGFVLHTTKLDFKRYQILLKNKMKRHISHIGFKGVLPTKSPIASPTKMMRKELKKEMYIIIIQ